MKYTLALLLAVLMITSVFALDPKKEYAVTPDEYGMEYKEVKIPTEDGLELYGWLFSPSSTSYKIVVISGDGDGNMADNIEIVSSFLSLGFHVLTYDYRGYGKSSDFKINSKFYVYSQFIKDINAVHNYVDKTLANIPKIHLYGRGIGASLSICTAANKKVGVVMADSPYVTLSDIKDKLREVKGKEVMLPLGYDKTQLEPQYALESKGGNIAKILFIVGADDQIYNDKYIKPLVKMKSKAATTYVVKGAQQKTTFTINKDAYFKQIQEFL